MHSPATRDRLYARAIIDTASGCWIWTGDRKPSGYGRFRVAAGKKGSQKRAAHRVAWEIHNGAIPDGLQVDHLCGTPACVNPAHMELVTQVENLRRRGRVEFDGLTGVAKIEPFVEGCCWNGHVLTLDNTRPRKSEPGMACLDCERDRNSRRDYSASSRAPAVEPGQTWEDRNKQARVRIVHVDSVDSSFAFVTDAEGRKRRISLARMRSTKNGFRFVECPPPQP